MTLTALPNNSIQLDWTVPANNGYAITTYAVERSTDGINWSPLVAINANTYQDTGLTNSATYYYKVTAVNQIGNSAFSAPVSVIAGDVPAQVTGHRLQATGYRLKATSYRLQATGYRLQAASDGVSAALS